VEWLLQAGARVATCGRNSDKLYQLQVAYAGKPLFTKVADVSVEADCKRFIEEAADCFGDIHVLINNAGISMRALFSEASIDTLRRVMEINYWGAVYCTRYALPHLLKTKGDIVGISSIAGYRGLPGRSGYSASKWALQGWLEALRTELLQSGVNVMWVSPGFTSSNIRQVALNAAGRPQGESPMDETTLMPAEDCAAIILNAIAARRRSLILTFTGKRTVFLTRFFPRLADRLVHKYFFNRGALVK
jgi:short-subunit dehydrogenase